MAMAPTRLKGVVDLPSVAVGRRDDAIEYTSSDLCTAPDRIEPTLASYCL